MQTPLCFQGLSWCRLFRKPPCSSEISKWRPCFKMATRKSRFTFFAIKRYTIVSFEWSYLLVLKQIRSSLDRILKMAAIFQHGRHKWFYIYNSVHSRPISMILMSNVAFHYGHSYENIRQLQIQDGRHFSTWLSSSRNHFSPKQYIVIRFDGSWYQSLYVPLYIIRTK